MLFIKGFVVFSIYNLYSCNVKLIFIFLMEIYFFVFFLYYYLMVDVGEGIFWKSCILEIL